MDYKTERPYGLAGPLTFWKVGALLLIAFLVSGGIWLTMRSYQARVETEYREISALMINQKATQEDMEHFEEIWRRYEDVHDISHRGFAWEQDRIGIMAVGFGVGLFLWSLTLLQRGIIWLAKQQSKKDQGDVSI